jgi:predicted CXXCH cytochrome family protein
MHHVRILAVALAAIAPLAARAAGGHDAVGCAGCHSLHAAKTGEAIFAVAPNTKYLNPKTKQAYTGVTALCLGCHQDTDKGGQGFAPVSQHLSHPFSVDSVNPRIARVPPELLKNGKFECMGCHDPHPSNPYYKYLRVDTKGGKNTDAFCAVCHGGKADPSVAAEKVAFFNSIGNEGGAVPLPPAPKGTTPVKAPASSDAKPAKK